MQLKISGNVYGLLEVFIKSRSIVVDNEDDHLLYFCFPTYKILRSTISNTHTQKTKVIQYNKKLFLNAEHNFTFSNYMDQANKKRSIAVLDAFGSMNQYEMIDDELRPHFNITVMRSISNMI